jgi:hypothetical protein
MPCHYADILIFHYAIDAIADVSMMLSLLLLLTYYAAIMMILIFRHDIDIISPFRHIIDADTLPL